MAELQRISAVDGFDALDRMNLPVSADDFSILPFILLNPGMICFCSETKKSVNANFPVSVGLFLIDDFQPLAPREVEGTGLSRRTSPSFGFFVCSLSVVCISK